MTTEYSAFKKWFVTLETELLFSLGILSFSCMVSWNILARVHSDESVDLHGRSFCDTPDSLF